MTAPRTLCKLTLTLISMLAVFALQQSAAMAAPLTYVITLDSADGSFNGSAFTGKETIFTCTGDSDNYTGGPYASGTTQWVEELTCSVEVVGVVTGEYASAFRAFQAPNISGLALMGGSNRLHFGAVAEDIAGKRPFTTSHAGNTLQWSGSELLTTGEPLIFSNKAMTVTFQYLTQPVQALVETAALAAGDANCPAGGQQIDVGFDYNSSGALDADEIESTSHICNGSDGSDGADGVDGSDGADGTDGVDGTDGTDGTDGVDGTDGTDGVDGMDGTDGVDGMDGTDGVDGLTTLVKTTMLPAGDASCASGGVQVDAGVDASADGVLDDVEIGATHYICHGADGADGADGVDGADGADGADGTDGVDGREGKVSLSTVTPLPQGDEDCPAGGARLDSGLDASADGVLDADEVQSTSYICNGEDGLVGADGTDGVMGADGADGAEGGCSSSGAPGAPGPIGMLLVAMGFLFTRRRKS